MAKHTLVLDTNVIVASKYRLNSPTWRLVFALNRMGQVRLVVPEVVIREAVGRYRNDSRKAREVLDRLGIGLESLKEHFQEYETELRSELSTADIPTEPSCSMLDLADKAIYRRPPFNQGGNGFRDAMVWAHVIDAIEAHGTVVFLTGDGDFLEAGNPTALRKALAEESNGLVTPFKTVEEWISTIEVGDSPPEVHAAAAEKMVSANDRLTSMATAVLESQPVALGDRGSLDVEVTSVEITGPIALLSLKVSEEVDGHHLAVFRAGVEFTLETSGGVEERVRWKTRPLDVTGTMSYDAQSDEFGEPEFEIVDVPPPPRPFAPFIDVSGIAAAMGSLGAADRLGKMKLENSGLAAAIASMSDASKILDAQLSGIRSVVGSLPMSSGHPAFKFNALEKWAERQSAIAKIAADSISKSYFASLRPLAGLGEQMRKNYASMFVELQDGTPGPGDGDASREPDEA